MIGVATAAPGVFVTAAPGGFEAVGVIGAGFVTAVRVADDAGLGAACDDLVVVAGLPCLEAAFTVDQVRLAGVDGRA